MQENPELLPPRGGGFVRVLRAPFRLPLSILESGLLWMFARSNVNLLEPGEKMIAIDGEVEHDGNVWVASNQAVYIEPKASPHNRRLGPIKTRRIPYEWIEDVSEQRRGPSIERILRVADSLGSTEISGTFRNLRSVKLTSVIQEQVAARRQ